MIKKFVKIKNTGRFVNYSAHGEVSLRKVNIIYGENSTGKTTLSSIIRSLISNKPDLVLERKTLGSNDEQYIELLFENDKLLKFQNNNWNRWNDELKSIEVFDEFFINENIYTGLEIQSEHQKYLYQFAIGVEGTSLAKEIENMKQDLTTDKNPKLKNLKDRIEQFIKDYFEIDDFVKMTEDREIDQKIQKKKQELEIAKSSQEIKIKKFLKSIPKFSLSFDLNMIKILLAKSLTNISEKSLQKTKDHISKLATVLEKEAEPWLRQGLFSVEDNKDNKCPFCQQDLKNAEDTIKSYQQYFNSEYRELNESVEKYLEKIKMTNIEQLFDNVRITIADNNTLFEFWKRFLENIKSPEIKDFEKYYDEITKYFNEVKSTLVSKSQSILTPLETICVDNLSRLVCDFNKIIKNYNSSVENLNEQIKEVKSKQPDINELKKEINKLEIEKQRHSPEINELCEQYIKVKEEIADKNKSISEKKKKLKKAISEKVEKYGNKINIILQKFGAPFKISRPTQKYRGRSEEPYLEYFLELEECEINPIEKAKATLSGGDRNALALAFFIAKIIVEENIQEKIIIFDDPMSSFDINRKRRTIEFIRDLSKDANQVIVLTHINTFAFELDDALKDIGIKPKCLEIKNGQICEWNINEDKKHPYFRNLSKLESFVDYNQDIHSDEAQRLIRICLEDKLKFNYFHLFKDLGDDCWLGNIVKKLRDLKDDPNLKFRHSDKNEVIEELGNLCDFAAASHHGNINASQKKDYTQTEIVNYVNSAIKMIYDWL
jgi:wobble nucleotide-excising tRNase